MLYACQVLKRNKVSRSVEGVHWILFLWGRMYYYWILFIGSCCLSDSKLTTLAKVRIVNYVYVWSLWGPQQKRDPIEFSESTVESLKIYENINGNINVHMLVFCFWVMCHFSDFVTVSVSLQAGVILFQICHGRKLAWAVVSDRSAVYLFGWKWLGF